MTAVLARRIVMAGGVWIVGIAGSFTVLSLIDTGGWLVRVLAFGMGHVVWTAAKRVWRWSEVEP